MDEAHALGRTVTHNGVARLRAGARVQLRRSMGVTPRPPAPCTDPEAAYFPPGSVTRRVHGDLPAMLIGGLSALLLQMLHPLAMAAVAEHSAYRSDPLGRLRRTSRFLGSTTFGTREEAAQAVARVRSIHDRVTGTAPDGRRYSAADPALLAWVHAAEVTGFLAAARAYGPERLTPAEEDTYLDEMARVALALGATEPPRSVAALDDYLAAVRPELRLTREARTARNFMLRGPGRWPHEVSTYALLVAAAQGVLPPWARRQLGLPAVPAADRLAVRPAARALSGALRWIAAPAAPTAPAGAFR